jgi:hypothetical protein
LCSLLRRARRWHRTSISGLQGILGDSAIVPNSGQLPNTWPQSEGSLARHLGGISLFDFDGVSEETMRNGAWIGVGCLSTCLPDAAVLIGIQFDDLASTGLLLPCDLQRLSPDVRDTHTFIPHVEAICRGRIPATSFGEFILTAFSGEGIIWKEVAFDGDAFSVISSTAAAWRTEYERKQAERHSRGEYTLEEIVKKSFQMATPRSCST